MTNKELLEMLRSDDNGGAEAPGTIEKVASLEDALNEEGLTLADMDDTVAAELLDEAGVSGDEMAAALANLSEYDIDEDGDEINLEDLTEDELGMLLEKEAALQEAYEMGAAYATGWNDALEKEAGLSGKLIRMGAAKGRAGAKGSVGKMSADSLAALSKKIKGISVKESGSKGAAGILRKLQGVNSVGATDKQLLKLLPMQQRLRMLFSKGGEGMELSGRRIGGAAGGAAGAGGLGGLAYALSRKKKK